MMIGLIVGLIVAVCGSFGSLALLLYNSIGGFGFEPMLGSTIIGAVSGGERIDDSALRSVVLALGLIGKRPLVFLRAGRGVSTFSSLFFCQYSCYKNAIMLFHLISLSSCTFNLSLFA